MVTIMIIITNFHQQMSSTYSVLCTIGVIQYKKEHGFCPQKGGKKSD